MMNHPGFNSPVKVHILFVCTKIMQLLQVNSIHPDKDPLNSKMDKNTVKEHKFITQGCISQFRY